MTEQVRLQAMKILERRDVSRKMLVDRLTEKGAAPEEAQEAADWLCSLGLLDDARYAGLVVRHYAGKGYGPRRIREELYRRGIPKPLWEPALEELPETADTALRLLRSRLRGGCAAQEDLRRAAAYLQRRGFSWEEIRTAVERYQTETEDNGYE